MRQQFYQVGGSLPANAKSYIKREADEKLYNYLKEGKYCYVLNARQVGKSSLRVHTSKRLEEDGYGCVNIDLTSIGSEDITADEWYFSFLYQVIEQLNLDEELFVDWWEENDKFTVVNRFAKVFDSFILAKTEQNIVIFVDEVDAILGIKRDFSTNDFFAVIRMFYNLRSEDERYNRIAFALFGVATPEDLMRDSSRTPFNIAHGVTIEQFKLEESLSLLEGLRDQTVDGRAILERIFDWTSGTPYLTQKILDYIVHHPIEQLSDIDHIVERLFIQENFKEINISNIQNRIVSNEKYNVKMLYLIADIIKNGSKKLEEGSLEQIYLKLSGLMKEQGSLLVYTNKIYQQIFNQAWVLDTLSKIDRPFSQDLQRWMELDKPSSALLKGKVLKKAKKWASERDDLTSGESEYLRLSSQLEQETLLNEEKKKEESRRVKSLSIFSLILIVVSMGIVYIYFEAKDKEEIANRRLEKIQALTYNDYCHKGDSYFSQKKYKKAIVAYEKAIGIDDQKKIAYTKVAKAYHRMGAYTNAITIYRKIVKIDDQDDKSWNNLGYTYFLMGDYNNALESLTHALKVNPDYYYAYNTMGLVYLQQHKPLEAMKMFEKSIEIEPNYSKPYINKGEIYFNTQQYDDAILAYNKALTIQKGYWAYYKRGVSYLQLKKYKEAIESYTNAIKYVSEHKEQAYKDRGFAYFKLEQYVKAKESFEEAIRLNPKLDINYYTMGVIYDSLEEFQKAKEMYKKGVVDAPKTKEALINNGNIYLKLKQYDKALLAYSQIIKAYPTDHEAFIKLGIIYNELGKQYRSNYKKSLAFYNKALLQFDKALALNPNDDNAYYNRGNTYYRMGRKSYEKAIEQYQQAIRLNPSNDKAYNDLAYTYLRQGKYQTAISAYQDAIHVNPKHYKAYNSMGVAYLKLARVKNQDQHKNNQKAIKAFQQSIKINPEQYKAYINIFNFQLFNGEPFDWGLEYDYKNIFKNQKEIFIQYEILKILQKISEGEDATVLLHEWQDKYQNIKLKNRTFKVLKRWAKKHKKETRNRLLEAIDTFENHNKALMH